LQQEQQRINKSMRLAQGILMIVTLAQPVIRMMTVNTAIHMTQAMAMDTMAVAVIPVTERSK
jgi:hypothetical protein